MEKMIPVPHDLQPGAQTAQWVLDQITTFPETHDQTEYASKCGTAHCVAGWAAVVQPAIMARRSTAEHPTWGAEVAWDEAGMEALQIGWFDAETLFWGGLHRENVILALKALANGEEIDWE